MKDFSADDRAVRTAFPIDEDHGAARRSKRKKFRRGVSKIIKGAFSHALPAKKSRNHDDDDVIDVSTKTQKTLKEIISTPSNHDDDDDDMSTSIQKTLKEPPPPLSSATVTAEGVSSSRYTAISSNPQSNSSSRSSSRSTSARNTSGFYESNSNSNMMKPMKKCKVTSLNKRCGDYYHNYNDNSNIGLYIFLISLVGLVFWGKAFAILCTATCLICFNPRRRRHVDFIDFADDPS